MEAKRDCVFAKARRALQLATMFGRCAAQPGRLEPGRAGGELAPAQQQCHSARLHLFFTRRRWRQIANIHCVFAAADASPILRARTRQPERLLGPALCFAGLRNERARCANEARAIKRAARLKKGVRPAWI